MRNTALLYQKLSSSLATSIYGHEDIKRGLLLQLIGGVHKQTADGGSIRGDINICIVGDPSTAKSQFLKYINSISPRSVYTSGKSSSAAGLTVGVGRDVETGEMCLEAGRADAVGQRYLLHRRVRQDGTTRTKWLFMKYPTYHMNIPKAMEQQTISITKAGITATLNARASILAAANPIGGRYDRSKSLKANISLTGAADVAFRPLLRHSGRVRRRHRPPHRQPHHQDAASGRRVGLDGGSQAGAAARRPFSPPSRSSTT